MKHEHTDPGTARRDQLASAYEHRHYLLDAGLQFIASARRELPRGDVETLALWLQSAQRLIERYDEFTQATYAEALALITSPTQTRTRAR